MTTIPGFDSGMVLEQATQHNINKAAAAARAGKSMEQIETAAREFEAVFVSEMMKPMFEGISTDGQFGGGKGEEIFRGVLITEYGKLLSKTGRVGISDSIKAEMIRMQGEQVDTQTPKV